MKKSFVFGILLVIIGAGLLLGRAPYWSWKEKHYLARARECLASGDFGNAATNARKSLDANPANLDACRVMAAITEHFRMPDAIFWRRRIVELQPDVAENRLALARTAMMLGNIQEASQAVASVKPADRNRADYHEIAALLDTSEKNMSAAETEAAEAVKLDPTNKMLQMNLGTIDIQSKNPQLVQNGKQRLEQLSADPALRRAILRELALAETRDGNYSSAQSFASQLISQQPVSFDDQLLNLSVLKESKSKSFPVTLAYVEKQLATNAAEINALSSWLTGQHMTDHSLQWLLSLPEATRKQPQVQVTLADCYAALGEWSKMQALLSGENWNDLEFLRLALLARALRGQNNELAAKASWHTAVTSAGTHEQPLSTLTRLADSWGWNREKEDTAWLLVDQHPQDRWALQMLERYYGTNGNTRGIQKVFSTLIKTDKSDMLVRNNFAAVSLLVGEQLPEARQIAQEDYSKFPQSPAVASTYAYSLHLQGRTQDGLNVMEKLPADALRQPGIAAYYGPMLVAGGQPVKARDYLNLARQAKLLPEERAMLATALNADPQRVK